MAVTHPKVIVFGRSEAAALLRGCAAADVGMIISIHGRREPPFENGDVSRSLVLQFDDTETPIGEDPVADYLIDMRQRRAEASGVSVPPTIEHAQAIIDFAREIGGTDKSLLCQCQGGVSRSSAAALLCLAAWTGAGEEAYCVGYLRTVRPCAVPHRGLVVFGDKLLERGGQLIDKLDATQQYDA